MNKAGSTIVAGLVVISFSGLVCAAAITSETVPPFIPNIVPVAIYASTATPATTTPAPTPATTTPASAADIAKKSKPTPKSKPAQKSNSSKKQQITKKTKPANKTTKTKITKKKPAKKVPAPAAQ